MIRRNIPPSIEVVLGNHQTGRDFDGVHSIPAAYLFDAKGREILRVGGDKGPPGRHFLNRRQLVNALKGVQGS